MTNSKISGTANDLKFSISTRPMAIMDRLLTTLSSSITVSRIS